ncbi:MAG: kelch repeat-containing protein, partial [Thermoplasmata archaeon]
FGGTNGTADLNDTKFFDPGNEGWTPADTSTAPSPRSNVAADFLNTTGNQTLILYGGASGAGPLSDAWRLSATSNLTVQVSNLTSGQPIANATVGVSRSTDLLTNASGMATAYSLTAEETTVNASVPGFAPAARSLWLAPGENVEVPLPLTTLASATVLVTVVGPNATGIEGSAVNLSFGHRLVAGSPHFTDVFGVAEFVDVPSAVGTVSASHPGFHSNTTKVEFAPGTITEVNLTLSPTLVLSIHTLGVLENGSSVVLQGVRVFVAGLVAGVSSPTGWLNISTNASGTIPVFGEVYGFHNATLEVPAGFSGVSNVTLKLRAGPFPSITAQVVGRSSGSLEVFIRNATLTVANTSFVATGPYLAMFSTGRNGSVEFSPPPGNYSFQASAPGYVTNSSSFVLNAQPGIRYLRTIYLVPVGFSTLDVRVVSSAPGVPAIGGASVVLNVTGLNLTDGLSYPQRLGSTTPSGWSNFSGVPATVVIVVASAPGFYPNSTPVSITNEGSTVQVTVFLKPLPAGTYSGLRILPTGSGGLWALALLPVAALVGALVYLTMLRTPSLRTEPALEATPGRGGRSDETARR